MHFCCLDMRRWRRSVSVRRGRCILRVTKTTHSNPTSTPPPSTPSPPTTISHLTPPNSPNIPLTLEVSAQTDRLFKTRTLKNVFHVYLFLRLYMSIYSYQKVNFHSFFPYLPPSHLHAGFLPFFMLHIFHKSHWR